MRGKKQTTAHKLKKCEIITKNKVTLASSSTYDSLGGIRHSPMNQTLLWSLQNRRRLFPGIRWQSRRAASIPEEAEALEACPHSPTLSLGVTFLGSRLKEVELKLGKSVSEYREDWVLYRESEVWGYDSS